MAYNLFAYLNGEFWQSALALSLDGTTMDYKEIERWCFRGISRSWMMTSKCVKL